jgi:hypothetical protein
MGKLNGVTVAAKPLSGTASDPLRPALAATVTKEVQSKVSSALLNASAPAVPAM